MRLTGGEYEGRDVLQSILGFGTPVTRTYTLQVANDQFEYGKLPPSAAHITGWDYNLQDWIYNENEWRKMDQMVHLSRRYGVKLIIPIINQDYGNPYSDYIGNFNDLIRHRYNIYEYKAASQQIDFFTDSNMIDAYMKLITFFLNRINTYNGIRYGEDHTILAFETGNELNWGISKEGPGPPPAQWTLEISRHLKKLAPRTLVMDGSFSRNPTNAWREEVLTSQSVDIMSYHFYGGGDTESFDMLNEKVRAYSKTLVIGEHGFYSDVNHWRRVYEKMTCAGALVWSLYPHSEYGGFLTHGEGHNVHGYHVPGWQNQTSPEFDIQEAEAVASTYDASFSILGLEPPPKPVPGAPEVFFVENGTNVGLSWRGTAWAAGYEVFGAETRSHHFELISEIISDNVVAGGLLVPLNPQRPTQFLHGNPRRSKVKGARENWTDNKWCFRGKGLGCNWVPPLQDLIDNAQKDIFRDTIGAHRLKLLPSMLTQGNGNSGGWYSVRAVSVDGVPGRRSEPVFLPTEWSNQERG